MWCVTCPPPPVFLPIKLPRHKYLGTGAQLLLRFNEKWKKFVKMMQGFLIWYSSRTLKKICLFPFHPFSGPKFTKQLNWHHNALTEEPPPNQPQLNNWSACWAVAWFSRADRQYQNLPEKLKQSSAICWNSLGLFRD